MTSYILCSYNMRLLLELSKYLKVISCIIYFRQKRIWKPRYKEKTLILILRLSLSTNYIRVQEYTTEPSAQPKHFRKLNTLDIPLNRNELHSRWALKYTPGTRSNL